jgi:glycosyltransferase involved in cell wall biosynthesis
MLANQKISICIPTYGMNGKGSYYLQKNLSSIFSQNLVPHEVIISDHSKDDAVQKTAESWKEFLPIRYFRNENKVGSISANLNNCLSKATGDIIDFMLQDDLYYAANSLQDRVTNLGDKQWAVTATIHYSVEREVYYWHLIPEYRQDIYMGFNSIGSPSLLTMKREHAPLFDENLVMLTDCDYYKQLYDKFGLPKIAPDITVVSVMWDGQTQKSISPEKIEQEKEIVKKKFENGTN